jgi:hypothetical protein
MRRAPNTIIRISMALIIPEIAAAVTHLRGISQASIAIRTVRKKPTGIALADGQSNPSIRKPTTRIGINAKMTNTGFPFLKEIVQRDKRAIATFLPLINLIKDDYSVLD